MAALTYLDSHVLVWLYGLGGGSLSSAAREAIETAGELRASPMARLELQYLYEVGRTSRPAETVMEALRAAVGLTICGAAFAAVARHAESYTWTRDPFDRLIVAQAALHDAPLVTKDQTLHAHYHRAVW